MRCKKIFDGRSLPRKAKEQLRMAAVKRVDSGESPESVAAGMGINRRQIYRWLEAFHYGGQDALKAKPIKGATPKLNSKQMRKLSQIIKEKNPLQLKFEYALWTPAIIRKLIHREFGVSLSEVSVGRLMRRLGFSPQRPLYRAWQQNPQLVDEWRATEYPQIVAKAKRDKALIFFADESGIRSDYHAGTTWASVGQTPLVKATGARFSLNMISAVNSPGHFRFMTVDGRINASVFRDFLARLITGMDRKVFLIVDGHPTHKAKMVRQFVEKNKKKIELFFLPAYSPELNPDELAWAHVKAKIAKATTQTKDELKKTVMRVMRRLQKTPHIVKNFFHAPSCVYAIL
ncbi:MAG: IS630 family transposase [Nitrospirae bacterium]|nr:MAG: IS630 family transposase [Nitrospirota bacterium]